MKSKMRDATTTLAFRYPVLAICLLRCLLQVEPAYAQDASAASQPPASVPSAARQPPATGPATSGQPSATQPALQPEAQSPPASGPAQPAPAAWPPAEPSVPAAAGTAAGPPPEPEPDPQLERALPHIEQGEVFFEDENYEAALAEFERAYQTLEGHPKRCQLSYNIGFCHERLFRYDRALDHYERYLAECGPNAEKRDKVQQILGVLRHLLGTLRISVNVSAEVWVDDVLVGQAPGDLLVASGRHTVELRSAGHESAKREVTVPSGGVHELSFDLEEIGDYEGISPAFFATAAGLSAISIGLGALFGIQALSKSDDAEQAGPKATPETADEIDDMALRADIFFAAGGLLAVGAGLLAFLTDWSGEAEEQEPTPAQGVSNARATLQPVFGGTSLQLTGSF